MATTIDQGWLEALCRRSDELLWQGYAYALAPGAGAWPRVMFPLKGGERRVGEQEARFAFVSALLSDPAAADWAFAAEAPTRLSYRFAHRGTQQKAQRALTDLALYARGEAGHEEPALNVEFKAGGRSGKSERDDSVRKDVAKIVAESPDALWFHVVRNANSATLGGLLSALQDAFFKLSNPLKLRDYLARGKDAAPAAKTVAVHVCVLNPDLQVSIHRVLDYRPGKIDKDFFAIAASFGQGELLIPEGQEWSVHRP